MPYRIVQEECKGCDTCARSCPTRAASGPKKEPHTIDASRCIECGGCARGCPEGARTVPFATPKVPRLRGSRERPGPNRTSGKRTVWAVKCVRQCARSKPSECMRWTARPSRGCTIRRHASAADCASKPALSTRFSSSPPKKPENQLNPKACTKEVIT
jgi:NAD-dependent dihydropyrimidine dehydrogenase PreA subunit